MRNYLFSFFVVCQTLLSTAQDVNLEWAVRMGGTGSDRGLSLAVGPDGSVYTAGDFNDIVDFNPGAGSLLFNAMAFEDGFIQKLDSNGTFLWAKQLHGNKATDVTSIQIDLNGNLYLTGWYNGTTDFDPGPNVFNLTPFGDNTDADIFVLKLDSGGNFIWAKGMGGTQGDVGLQLALDTVGNVYVTGYFSTAVDFDPNAGVNTLITMGSADAYVLKLDFNGNLLWVKQMGGSVSDTGYSITTTNDAVYTTGRFMQTVDFNTGNDTLNFTSLGLFDIFVHKLDLDGNFKWAKQMGGPGDEWGHAITTDNEGNVIVSGIFEDTVDFDPGVNQYDLIAQGGKDIFIEKLDSSGNFLWTNRIGGNGEDETYGITTDLRDEIYITGYFYSSVDFNPGAGSNVLYSNGGGDIFLEKLNPDGDFIWAIHMGGTDLATDYGTTIRVDSNGYMYLTGVFSGSADFNPGPGSLNFTSDGLYDIFVQKLSQPTLGLEHTSENFQPLIYPNPTNTGLLNIRSDQVRVEEAVIYSITGEFIKSIKEPTTLNVSELPSGIYLISFNADGRVITKNFIVQ